MILKLEEEINDFNHAWEALKETHTSLIDERYNVSDTLLEKMEIVECVECPTLKLEIGNLKRQLTHATSLSCTCSSSLSKRGKVFKKNPHVTKRNRRSISSKYIFHYCCDKGQISLFFILGTFKFPMEK